MVKVGDIEVVPGFIIAETDLRERFSHSSGPGGQGVNTTDSRVELCLTSLVPVPSRTVYAR